MRLTFCLTLCLLHIFTLSSAGEGKYTVIAPGTIHSHDKYTAAVAVYQTDTPCVIKVGITGPSYNETKEVTVSQNEVQNVEFDLPELEKGDYNLTAEGANCFDHFKNTTRLNYNKFNTHVRIQTDKGVYKPGDNINYRVIFMDKDLKPAEANHDAVIWFEDGRRNRITEIKEFQVVNGVHSGKFKISEFPVLGNWRLGVSNGGRYDSNVNFKVDKYVLPKFVVEVKAPKSVSSKDGDMQVVVRSNYIYGKPLNGKVTVIITLGSHQYNTEQLPPTLIKASDMVEGKAKINFNVKDYDAFMPNKISYSFLRIKATAEEQFTGVKKNGTAITIIYPYRFSMRCVVEENCSTFEVGKERDVLFQINYIDGSQLQDTKSTVELIYTEVLDKYWQDVDENDSEVVTTMMPPVSANHTISFRGHMNKTGFVNFKVALPELAEYEGYWHYYSMELKYLDEQREIYSTFQYKEPKEIAPLKSEDDQPKEYFILKDKYSSNEKLYLNTAAQLTLNSSEPLTNIVYSVICRGNIFESGRLDLPDKSKVYNFTLTPGVPCAPNFAVYVYTVTENGEFRYAEQTYSIEFELQNQINVTAPEQVKPGEEVALKIQTEPNSFVGLMAVDQSILLLKNNNDLRPFEFKHVLGSYITMTPYQGGFSEYPGTTSGCVTLTNGDYFYNWTKPNDMYENVGFRIGSSGDAISHKAAHVNSGARVHLNSANDVQVRKDFSETWLFADIENIETDNFTLTTKIPDTITSWVLTAFSLSSTKGLGVTRDTTKLTTFQPFFISVRLPYSVKRGEVINVPALVFNYLDRDLDVTVTLDNSDNEYEFIEFDNETVDDEKRSKSIRIPASSSAGVSFLLKPKAIGNVLLKFTAISAVAGDAIHKTMKVVPEGLTQYINRAYFVNLKQNPEFKSSFELELPTNLVPDSEHVEVGVIGDILGPVLNNLDNLVRLPSGCGEQTMSSLLPSYLILKYLSDSKRLTSTMNTKLRYNLETGYQNILNYRHADGSFSSFGPTNHKKKPNNGSTWLTAYVVRSLQQLKEFIIVNEEIIEKGLEYISQQQADNGSFTEKGDYFYASQRNHLTLSGTAVLAILENSTYAGKYSQQLNKSLDFIVRNVDKSDSLHALAFATFTLNKAKHPETADKLTKLKSVAKAEADHMWWTDQKHQYGSNDIEITSYALLTLLDQESTQVDDVVPIIKWLIAQRNSNGGFYSTQDTMVALTALIKFADHEPAKMIVDIESESKNETVYLTEDNGIIYQTVEMDPKTKAINFTAQGTGSALVQITYQYNIFENDPEPSFTIQILQMKTKNYHLNLKLLVCVSYVGDGDASNMALLEITTPSGYIFNKEKLDELKALERVSNIELKNSDSLLVVYFDHLYKEAVTCIKVDTFKTHNVALQKPASMLLYDYYDPSTKAYVFYQTTSTLCDICETEDECRKCK